MRKVYCTNSSPWESHAHPMDSGTWKHIMNSKKLAQLYIATEDSDNWVWTASASGNFTFTSAWDVARTPSPPFDLTEVVWCTAICPKMSCCLLRALSNRLLTRSRLLQFGITDQDLCVRCHTSSETIEYLFFSCEYSAHIWTVCKLKLGLPPIVHSLLEEANSFKTMYSQKKKSSALGKLVLASVVYHLWKERNDRVFAGTEHTKVELIKKIIDDVRILMKTCKWKKEGNTKEMEIFGNWNLYIEG